nr:ribonuclease H-like domain-containing protein [Tanacetum cinerariifolium]
RSDLDTMSLDDLYNHLKVYESEVQKKSDSNSQNMAFISSAKHSSGKEEVNIASVSTASTNVSTASANIGVASISQDTACAYIASQSSGIHTIVWRNRNDLDSMSLDDLYNHLKVYESEVQKKSTLNPQDMAFISSSKNSNNEDGNTVCITTATTPFPTGSVNVATISQDTASAFIASQSN